jgi:hypothetical protein
MHDTMEIADISKLFYSFLLFIFLPFFFHILGRQVECAASLAKGNFASTSEHNSGTSSQTAISPVEKTPRGRISAR